MQATLQRMAEEPPEYPFRAPFRGIMSEMPLDMIDEYGGVLDSLNVWFRKGIFSPRPGYTALATVTNPIVGIADFYDANEARWNVVMCPASPIKVWNVAGQSWDDHAGVLSGSSVQYFTATTVAQKLLFCQGVDKVKVWDGAAAGFTDVSANAVPAFYLAEVNQHLIAAYTVEGGQAFPQRFRYTAAGDPTDWIGPNAGTTNIVGNLGPISGVKKIGQQGWIFHYDGLTQLVPTNVGTAPFSQSPWGDIGKGCYFPYSLASQYGDVGVIYVGRSDIYKFNGSSFDSIANRPLEGSQLRTGAHALIMAELNRASQRQVFGFVGADLQGIDYNAYWLIIPNGSVWVYNLDEENWTRFVYNKTPQVGGRFFRAPAISIGSLVGTIAQQAWTPASMPATSSFDTVLLGFSDGTPAVVDPTVNCESTYAITSGNLCFKDRRHTKTITRVRLVYQDLGATSFTFTLTNEKGQSVSSTVAVGGTTLGGIFEKMVTLDKINGLFFNWTISGATGTPASIIEVAPIPVIGGEYKNN